ncbi:DUF4253 domain-containing protein [Streptomyces acidicola]|uniref:DUF4253 domain-containing protein n=1 Tax=Streptomyces acidicola TaxID=2596892 RepID=UPI0034397EA6
MGAITVFGMKMPSNPLTVLVSDPAGRSLGLNLPPGSLVTTTRFGPWQEPLFWVADEIAGPDARGRLLPACEAVGLRPVLLQAEKFAEKERWWNDGRLDPGMMADDPSDHDAGSVLASYWAVAVGETDDDEDGETLAPFSADWPGLAPAGRVEADPDVRAAEVAAGLIEQGWLSSPRLGLVPVSRDTDIPASIGWTGPSNDDAASLRAVLRSWEDRFGARLLALSYARLDLSVAAPPQTMEEALAVAAEHFAFCPDNVWQGYETMSLYAEEAVLGNSHWTFWWD